MARPTTAGKNRQTGFTYIALLISIAVTGAALAAVGELTSVAAQREKENELLFVGAEIRHAIGAFYERSPGGAKRYPTSLEELVEDKRHPVPQRYLRRVYPDPMTGKPDWGVVEAPQGGIMGVYSLSELQPMKTGNFSTADQGFTDGRRYSDWKFLYAPPAPPAQAASSPSPS
ncbi:MAG TPA: type II secretion system protein [Burkholderiales bacterium]|nr:type II secretion system protein [Burkholderiales bacterium]